MLQGVKMHSSMRQPGIYRANDYSRPRGWQYFQMCYKVREIPVTESVKKTKHLAIESACLNFHSAKCYYSAVQPSESEPPSPKSSPRPRSEAAEWRQPSAPQTITR